MTPEEWLASEFERCWHWLEAALNASPMKTHNKEHIWAGIQSGDLELWPTAKSAVVIQIITYPTGLKVLHGLLAGGDISEIKRTVALLEARARELGCHHAAPQGRDGWLRALPGYRKAYTVMCKDLN